MVKLKHLLVLLAIYPWLDFVIRLGTPTIIGSIWDDLFLLVILIAFLIEKRQEQRYLIVPKSVKWSFQIFLLFSISSIIINVVPLAVSIDVLRVVFQPMLFAIITFYLLDEEETTDAFIRLMVVSTVLIAIAGIIQYLFKIESVRWVHNKDLEQFRIVSIFSNPNALAGYLNMLLSFTIALFLYIQGKWQKIAYFAASLIIFVALLLTFSRGAWIAFFVMVLYLLWIWNKKWLLALPLFVAITPFVMPDSVVQRFANLLDPTYYQMSSEYGRIAFWLEALQKIKENPLFGMGLGMFGDSVPLRHNIPFSTWVDNHYLKLGAEIGIFGLSGFLLLLVSLFILNHRMIKQAPSNKDKAYLLGIAGVQITMAIQNVTASIFEALANAVYFYAFMGMLLAFVWRNNIKKSKLSERGK